MMRRFKWAVAALLGFSAACSSVRHTTGGGDAEQTAADTVAAPVPGIERPRIVVMYGVRAPRPVVEVVPQDNTVDPVAERPVDSLDVRIGKPAADTKADE